MVLGLAWRCSARWFALRLWEEKIVDCHANSLVPFGLAGVVHIAKVKRSCISGSGGQAVRRITSNDEIRGSNPRQSFLLDCSSFL